MTKHSGTGVNKASTGCFFLYKSNQSHEWPIGIGFLDVCVPIDKLVILPLSALKNV